MQRALLDGKELLAWELPPAEFNGLRAIARSEPGRLTSPGGSPVIPKGTQLVEAHFALRAGYRDAFDHHETREHIAAKATVHRTATALGWNSTIEHTHPDGEWRADVLLTKGERAVAVEVQWSPQTLEEYHRRTARYRDDGIETIWVVRHTARAFGRLKDAIPYAGLPHGYQRGDALPELEADLTDALEVTAGSGWREDGFSLWALIRERRGLWERPPAEQPVPRVRAWTIPSTPAAAPTPPPPSPPPPLPPSPPRGISLPPWSGSGRPGAVMSAPCSACGVDFAFPALEGGLHGPKRGWGAGQAKAWGRMAARLRVERAYGFTYGDWCCPWCGAVVNDRWLFERGKEVQVTEGPPREGPWDVLF